MKKTIKYILAVLLFSVAAVLLFAVLDNRPSRYYGRDGENAAELSFTQSRTVLPDFIYNSSAIRSAAIYSVKSVDDRYQDPADADAELLCTVIDVYYTFISGAAWTQADVRVDEVIRGRLSEGDMISVYFPGGYASMEDYTAVHGEGMYSASGADFLEFTVNGRPHPKSGDNGVVYIDRLPDSSPLPEGAYLLRNVNEEDEEWTAIG